MSLEVIVPYQNIPKFVSLIEGNFSDPDLKKISSENVKTILEDSFATAIERGLNDEEFSLMIKFFLKAPINTTNRVKLLKNAVPSTIAPFSVMKQFMVWFISNYQKKENKRLSEGILKWLIGLLENNLVDPKVIEYFYFDYYTMLDCMKLRKCACALLCMLTSPGNVSGSGVKLVSQFLTGLNEDKFIYAVLNVFKNYKPHLLPENLNTVDVRKVLRSLPQDMDTIMKVVYRKHHRIEASRFGVFGVATANIIHVPEGRQKINPLIPYPTYSREVSKKALACYPSSIPETLKRIKTVPVPQNILSLLYDEIGFFIIMYKGHDLQKQFSMELLRTLQAVLIRQELQASWEDKESLLSRTYQLQMYMQQGIPCVSVFLSGYLLNWDGLDHRPYIMNLIEWAAFDTFQELNTNILRPLFMMFVSFNVTMKQEIIQTATNLLRNMFSADTRRVRQGLPHPFMRQAPAWTSKPLTMLSNVINWVEGLIKLGLCLEPNDSSLLMKCIQFYEKISVLEAQSGLPMWTVVTRNVVLRCLFNVAPIELGRVCRLLLRYHKEFLPQLRAQQPEFYNRCSDKINMTSRFIQELMNFLWAGQVMTRKEEGNFISDIPEEMLVQYSSQVNMDTLFDVGHHVTFLPYIITERIKNGPDFLQKKEDFLMMLEFHVKDIADFISYFSDSSASVEEEVTASSYHLGRQITDCGTLPNDCVALIHDSGVLTSFTKVHAAALTKDLL